jgi:hypothetical protein
VVCRDHTRKLPESDLPSSRILNPVFYHINRRPFLGTFSCTAISSIPFLNTLMNLRLADSIDNASHRHPSGNTAEFIYVAVTFILSLLVFRISRYVTKKMGCFFWLKHVGQFLL